MTRFESRPSQMGGLWEYVFFIDLEGHIVDAPIKSAFETIKHKAGWVRHLGSYPVSII